MRSIVSVLLLEHHLEFLSELEECGAGLRPVPYEDLASNPSDYYDSSTFEPSLSNPNDITEDISVLFNWAQCFKKNKFSFYSFTTIQQNIDSQPQPPSQPLTPLDKAATGILADHDSDGGLGGGNKDTIDGDSSLGGVNKNGDGEDRDHDVGDSKNRDNDGGGGENRDDDGGGAENRDNDGGGAENMDGDGGAGENRDGDEGGGEDESADGGGSEAKDANGGGAGNEDKNSDEGGAGDEDENGDGNGSLRGGKKDNGKDEDDVGGGEAHSSEDEGNSEEEGTPPETKSRKTHKCKGKRRAPPVAMDAATTTRSVTRAAVSNAGRQLRKRAGEPLNDLKPSKRRRGV
jgi:hypothetical protein